MAWNRMVRPRTLGLALALGALACQTARSPRLVWEGDGVPTAQRADEATRRLVDAEAGVRLGSWGASADATFQLIEAERAETPHVHREHDLTVVLLSGKGTLTIAGRRYELGRGDVVHIGRGRPHHFQPHGRAVGLAIYTPRMEGRDYHIHPPD